MARILCVQQTTRGPYWTVADSFDEDGRDLPQHAFDVQAELSGWVLVYRRADTVLDRPTLLTGAYRDARGNASRPLERAGRVRWYPVAGREITDADLRAALAHVVGPTINASILRDMLERHQKFLRPVARWKTLRAALERAQNLKLIGPPRRGRHPILQGGTP